MDAAVKGPSKAEEGESVIFTVKPEKGYVIDSVTADYMEVGLYEEARTASSSEAEYHGEPDFSKPQKYIIESVDADMEILIIMENEEALAEASVTLDDGTTVTAQWDAGIIPERAELDVREVTQEVKDAVIAGVEEAKKIGAVEFLAQGTIYPDVVESGLGGESARCV